MAKLKEGSKAPKFSVKGSDGKLHTLQDYKGKTLVLYFYPKDLTPGCSMEAKDFQESFKQFKKKKAIILGVSRDDLRKHDKFIEKLGLEFPLLADADGKLCQAYGVWQQKKFMGREFMGIVRSTFIIDSQGKIQKIYSPVKVQNHVREVLLAI